ncbi:hypothetical protein SUGI_0967420 [Cryptomeria japonica]|nr:hypothetical protein SUGI_0967420 [Cryptomeria japonica]
MARFSHEKSRSGCQKSKTWQPERPGHGIQRRAFSSAFHIQNSTAWLVWWYRSLQFATVSVDTRNEMVCNPFEQGPNLVVAEHLYSEAGY